MMPQEAVPSYLPMLKLYNFKMHVYSLLQQNGFGLYR